MSIKYSGKGYRFDRPFKLQGRVMLSFTPASVGSISRYQYYLNPIQIGTTKVLDDLAHQFLWFRFTKTRWVMFSATATVGSTISAGSLFTYPPITLPGSIDDIVECEFSAVNWGGQSVPSEMDLGRSELLQVQPKWFRVEPTGDDYLEYQGLFCWGDTNLGTATKYVLLEYEIEFLGLVDDPLTPRPVAGSKRRPGVQHEPPTVLIPGVSASYGAKRRRLLLHEGDEDPSYVRVPPSSPVRSLGRADHHKNGHKEDRFPPPRR